MPQKISVAPAFIAISILAFLWGPQAALGAAPVLLAWASWQALRQDHWLWSLAATILWSWALAWLGPWLTQMLPWHQTLTVVLGLVVFLTACFRMASAARPLAFVFLVLLVCAFLPMAWVIWRNGHELAFFETNMARLASSLGLLGIGAWLVLPKLWPTNTRTWARAVFGQPTQHGAQGLSKNLRRAACVAVATLPLGEGAAFGGAGLLAAVAYWERRHGTKSQSAAPFSGSVWALGAWQGLLAVLSLALFWSALTAVAFYEPGWPKVSELGRLGPFILIGVYYVALRGIALVDVRAMAMVYVGVSVLSAVFGLGVHYATVFLPMAWKQPLLDTYTIGQARLAGFSDRLVAGGFFVHRLKFAHTAVAAYGILISRQLLVAMAPKRRLLEMAALLLLAFAIVMTLARGAILAMAVMFFALLMVRLWRFWLVRQKKQHRRSPNAHVAWRWSLLGALSLGALSFLLLSLPQVQARLKQSTTHAGTSDRSIIWAIAMEEIAAHPYGIGPGNYRHLVETRYGERSDTRFPRTYAHNIYASQWLEAGSLGLCLYAMLWSIFLWGLWRRASRLGPPCALAAALLAISLGYWSIGLTHDVFYHKPVALTFAAFAGLALRLERSWQEGF